MGTITTQLVETGEKRDTCGRKTLPAARRAQLLREYEASGLTRAAFARREGLNYSTFAGWVQQTTMSAPEPIRFAQLRLPTPAVASGAVELEVRLLDGMTLRGNKVKELAALVRALRS